ncbi:7-carboxy-7-deazaguanine synthase QueE [Candidatus Pacearchaeota archaeon]|nr:7-carboxy-7-deazaguanine synthase QueE [Candidatus Pacearchaeota archaeon]
MENSRIEFDTKVPSTLGILSIFLTVDGECNGLAGQGAGSVFIRTRGCTVGCHWCDTKYSWGNKGGIELTPNEILEKVEEVADGCKKITITGGEPLQQDHYTLAQLVLMLRENGYTISIETTGHDIVLFRRRLNNVAHKPILAPIDRQVSFVVDYKCVSAKILPKYELTSEQLSTLIPGVDVVKVVIDSAEDFAEAMMLVRELRVFHKSSIAIYFSPSHNKVASYTLLRWMKRAECFHAKLDVRVNIQIHKYIYGEGFRDEEVGGFDWTKHSLGREAYLARAHEKGSVDEEGEAQGKKEA